MSQQDSPHPNGAQPAETQSHEANRVEAWAAVHRPETSSDELTRIAEAHPEFASAIADHPNAPAALAPEAVEVGPVQAQDSQQHFALPGPYAQPRYAQPQYSDVQYAQPQYPAPSYAAPRQPSSTNIAGIIAFSLLVVVTVLEFFVPVVMRQAMLTYNISLMVGFPLLRLILALCAIAIGIVGARMRSKPRLRWMAVGSIVAGSFLALPLLLSTLAYASPGLFPFYGY